MAAQNTIGLCVGQQLYHAIGIVSCEGPAAGDKGKGPDL